MISLLTPVHNTSSALLRQFIHSLRIQSYKDWELCIANDCSTSGETIEFLRNLRSDKSMNIKIIDLEENVGIGEATQKAFDISTGDYIAFADSDDELHPQAFETALKELVHHKADLVYSDEAITNMSGKITIPHFKPDFSYETFLSQNYICHFVMVKKSIYVKAGGLRGGFDGSQDHDFLLRVTEQTENIHHIPEILYYWRNVSESITHASDTKDKVWDRGVRAIQEHLDRKKIEATAKRGKAFGSYVIDYKIIGDPKVSIVIPFKDDIYTLKKCLDSIENSTYKNTEIIVVNNSEDSEKNIQGLGKDIRTLSLEQQFNYSQFLNKGIHNSTGDYIITMHDDCTPACNDWIEKLLQHAQKPGVGVVGPKLLDTDGKTQSVGIVIGIGGFSANAFYGIGPNDVGYFCRAINTQNVSAISSACMMFKKEIFELIGGFDAPYFTMDFLDIDFCLKALGIGKRNIVTPQCLVKHVKRNTRGSTLPRKVKNDALVREIKVMKSRYNKFISDGDPFYNKNLLKTTPYAQPKLSKNSLLGAAIQPEVPQPVLNIDEAPHPRTPRRPDHPGPPQGPRIVDLKTNPPLVSVIIPVYEHYPIAVSSMIVQTYQNFEILVVHDGPPPDEFKETIKSFNNSKIKMLNTSKRFDDWGHTPRSFGLGQVSEDSKFTVFTGADNYYVPKFLEFMLQAFTHDRINAAYCNLLHNYWDWTLINTKLVMGSIDCGCIMVRTDVAKQIGWKHKKHIADWLFMEELIKLKGRKTVAKVPKILFVHN